MALYSLVAWPPKELAAWVAQVQAARGLASYGAPHLNLRTAFAFSGDEKVLLEAAGRVAAQLPPFRVRFLSWRLFPHTIFLDVEPTPELLFAHQLTLLETGGALSEWDGPNYIPHLTLALGICSWAEQQAWDSVKTLLPPLVEWTVDEVALTLEGGGEIVEMARYPLVGVEMAK